MVLQGLYRRHHDLVATAVGEGQAMTFEAGPGLEHHVGGRVIAEVQRVGTVLLEEVGNRMSRTTRFVIFTG